MDYNKFDRIDHQDQFGSLAPIFIALFMGGVAFALRAWARPVYAMVEIVFGSYGAGIALLLLYKPEILPVGFQALAPSSTSYPQFIGLVSSIYVIARGIENGRPFLEGTLGTGQRKPGSPLKGASRSRWLGG